MRSRLVPLVFLTVVATGGLPVLAQPFVSPAWLRANPADAKVSVIDIRSAEKYQAGHVPGAVSADYATAGWRAATPGGAAGALPPVEQVAALLGKLGLANERHAVIVGDEFSTMARIYWTLKAVGHAKLSLLAGGWDAWRADPANPVSTEPVVATPVTFVAKYDPSIRAELPEVERAIATGSAKLIDARVRAQWAGTSKSPVVKAPGHLPGAIWVDQSAAVRAGATLKPAGELAELFAGVGDGPVVTYCNTGQAAATDWFVRSELLGRPNTKLYDGSMSEWTSDPSRPVVVEPN